MGKITATILTYNEEKRIAACLESLRDIADEIIVVDSFSTDRTLDICRTYGCRISQRPLAGYGAQRQYATSLASNSYVLSLDADEILSPALRNSLLRLKREGFSHRVYSFSRLNFYCGQPVKGCGWYPDTQIRLFDKRYANWNLHDVEERVIFRDTVKAAPVDGDILHYRCATPEEFNATENGHSHIRARVLATRYDSINPLRPMIEGIKAYFRCLILEKGLFDGRPGRAISRNRYHTTYMAYEEARDILKKGDSAQLNSADNMDIDSCDYQSK